jgi:hypothetical protein
MAFDVKKIKSLFVETSTDNGSKAVKKDSVDESKISNKSATVEPDKLDTKIVDSLLKAIVDKNLPGEDYLEFLEALNAMKNIPLEDNMKVQTVMATLSTKGLTVAKIKESAEYYKKVLANEQSQFTAELNNQVEKTIKTKEKDIESLKVSIKQKTEQIAALTKDINDAQQKISTTEVLIKAAESKIKMTQENFDRAYNFVLNQIDLNLSKLK